MIYRDYSFYIPPIDKPVAKLSQNMRLKLSEWEEKGYKVVEATVRFIVAWKPKEAPKEEPETAVLLADLRLVRRVK